MGRPSKRGTWARSWEGGRVWCAADGSKVYYIRRQVGGHRYSCTTGATTLRAALKQLERFEADPDNYRPANDPSTAPLYLDNDLSEAFLGWSKNDKGNTARWVEHQKHALAWWMEKLRGVNVRRARLREHILSPLEGAPGRPTKIRVLKAFYGWLRKERHLLTAHEDPTYGALSAPQSKPAQWKKSKVIPRDHYLLAREHLTGPWPDLLTVLAGTGWHLTELQRFATAGTFEPLPAATRIESGAVGVLVCPMHKSGDAHRTGVSQEVLDAAKRVRERGEFSERNFYKAIDAACRAVKLPVPRPDGTDGIPAFNPGQFRHSVATWAIEAGADIAAVSAFLGHKSAATTKRFYSTLAVAPKVPTLA